MSAIAIDISEFTGKMKELILRLKRGEEVIITADEQPVARLTTVKGTDDVQAQNTRKRRRAGTAEGTFWISPDFNEPLEEFKEYME